MLWENGKPTREFGKEQMARAPDPDLARVTKALGLQCARQSQEQQDGQRGGTAGTTEEEGARRYARAWQATTQTLAFPWSAPGSHRGLCAGEAMASSLCRGARSVCRGGPHVGYCRDSGGSDQRGSQEGGEKWPVQYRSH